MPEFRRQLVDLLPRLRRFASVLTKSHADAEDVVQAAVERALRHADSWHEGTRLDSWLYRIMQNVWRDELRAHRRRAEPLDSHADIAGADGRDVTIRHIQSSEAREALHELPEDQRVVIALVVLEGMSYQQTADILEVPVGTVMSRLARARAKLAASLGEGPHRVRAAK
jgi:RNA polymerase sigma-70 factor (ECF subfamily)